jgi:hypothetical protein
MELQQARIMSAEMLEEALPETQLQSMATRLVV